ncbi:NB-ARC domain-containing protein [Rhodovulum sulfidophilum]|uniref:NB-ARC domain-containing protein n=1 Tax=Rhodovulum sulfidophilum TaxID=35806 RepID=UPI001921C5A4|nr:NB-ARC domain-containing protein [Rhodovulum sulfidophilum]MBL3561601.1 hypothetical protein [Rhodovulum sulfidophilum]
MVRKSDNNDVRYASEPELKRLIDELFIKAFKLNPSLPGGGLSEKKRKNKLQDLVRIPHTEISAWSKGNKSDAERITKRLINFFSGTRHYIDLRKDVDERQADLQARRLAKQIGDLLRSNEKNDVQIAVGVLKEHLKKIKAAQLEDVEGKRATEKLKLRSAAKGRARSTDSVDASVAAYRPRVRASKNIIPRKGIFDSVMRLISDPEALTAADGSFALVGGGGYGKTTLATTIAQAVDELGLFDHVLQTTDIGKDADAIIDAIHLIAQEIEPGVNHRKPPSPEAASELLARVSGNRQLFIVVDNVWSERQVNLFRSCGADCVLLFTTRVRSAVQEEAHVVEVGRMTKAEAFALLSTSLEVPRHLTGAVRDLAETLFLWPQLLSMANRVLVQRCSHGKPLADAIAEYTEKLERKGIRGVDPENEKERSKAVEICFDESVGELSDDQLEMFMELGAFLRSAAIPIDVIKNLWDNADADDFLLYLLDGLALIEAVDYRVGSGIVALHDNVTAYLRQRAGEERILNTHQRILEVFRSLGQGKFETLPITERYGWTSIVYHLTEAKMIDEADDLRSSYAWLKCLLQACDIADVIRSYSYSSNSDVVGQVGRALAHSGQALARTPSDLPRQLVGRLGPSRNRKVQEFLIPAKGDDGFSPRPLWPHLRNIGHDYQIPPGHVGTVRSAVYSPNSKAIATASWDGSIMIWEASDFSCSLVFSGHTGQVQSVAWNPEGDLVVSGAGAGDQSVRLWDIEGQQQLRILGKHKERVRWVTFDRSGESVVSVSHDKSFGLWALDGDEVRFLEGQHPTAILTVDVHHSKGLIATASQDRFLRVFDLATGNLDCKIEAHNRWLKGAFWHPTEDWIVTASDDETVSIWRHRDHDLEHLRTIEGFTNGARSAAFSPDGRKLVVASARMAQIFNLDDELNATLTADLLGHTGQVLGAQFAPNGQTVVTSSHDHTARVFDVDTGYQIGKLGDNDRRVRSVSLSADGEMYVAVFDDGSLSVVSTQDRAQIYSDKTWTYQVAAFGNQEDTIYVIRTHDKITKISISGDVLCEYSVPHGSWIHDLVLSDNDTYALTASEDNTSYITQLTGAGRTIKANKLHSAAVKSVAADCALTKVFSTSDDRTASQWSRLSTVQPKEVLRSTGAVLCCDVCKNVSRVAFGSSDMRIYLSIDGGAQKSINEHTGAITAVQFVEDGEYIVSGSQDKTVKIFRCSDIQCITTIELDASVSAMSANGNLVCIGDNLGHVLLFELPDPMTLPELQYGAEVHLK